MPSFEYAVALSSSNSRISSIPSNQREDEFLPFAVTVPAGGVAPVVAAGPLKENWVFSATPPSLPPGGFILEDPNYPYRPFEPAFPPVTLLNQMFAVPANAPLFDGLEFALSVIDQLEPLNIWHYTAQAPGPTSARATTTTGGGIAEVRAAAEVHLGHVSHWPLTAIVIAQTSVC